MSKDEQAIEAEIQAKGLNAPRLSPEKIDAVITGEDYHVFPGTTLTVCCLTLRNGFTVTGESAAASPENFDVDLGKKIARSNARDKIWALEGYALRERLAAYCAASLSMDGFGVLPPCRESRLLRGTMMGTKCEVEHDWRRYWRGWCAREHGCAELARCEPFKRPPDPQGHPLQGLHINQGSLDAAADAYEAEYNKAHGIETPNVKVSGPEAASSPQGSTTATPKFVGKPKCEKCGCQGVLTAATGPTLQIGKISVSPGISDGRLWLEQEGGEGGDFSIEAIEQLLQKFYDENF